MSDGKLRLVLAALAAAASGIAAYLVYAHYADVSVVCSTGGCATVEESRYADVFGVPVALLGLLGSLAILGSLSRGGRLWRAAGLALAVCGLVFAAYLVVLQLAVIGAVCEWCLANDALVGVLAAGAVVRARADVRAWVAARPRAPRARPG